MVRIVSFDEARSYTNKIYNGRGYEVVTKELLEQVTGDQFLLLGSYDGTSYRIVISQVTNIRESPEKHDRITF